MPSTAADFVSSWEYWSWPARWFVCYALLATALSVVAMARVNLRARFLARTAGPVDTPSGSALRAWEQCFQKLTSLSRLVVLNFLLSLFVSADAVLRWMDAVSAQKPVGGGSGFDPALVLFIAGTASCCAIYALYCLSMWQVTRQRTSWMIAGDRDHTDRTDGQAGADVRRR